jgi:hypothetical protein
MRTLIPILLLPLSVVAQQPSVAPAWDISQTLAGFGAQVNRLGPVLEQLAPEDWIKNGAPEAYVAQWQAAQQELRYVINAAKVFENQPERLSAALDAYFRWQALEERLRSLVDGTRRYQNPALGDLLMSVVGENTSNRDQLRQYITDLAGQKEQELAVIDGEAQRCRDNLNRQQPVPRTPAPVKKK